MELDEDLALPVDPGVDVLTHRISLARLQHISNLAWCLGSWLPHLVSLAVLLIRLVRSCLVFVSRSERFPRGPCFSAGTQLLQSSHITSVVFLHDCRVYRQEHSQSGRGTEEAAGQSSPHVHIRKLCGPGAYGGGASDYADGDTASITTSGPRAASTVHEVWIRLDMLL